MLGALILLSLQARGLGPLAYCLPGQWPQYSTGFNPLSQRLEDAMGNSAECEDAVSAGGDAEQRTSTGLARYTAATNTPAFHVGDKHWALTSVGLVTWNGPGCAVPLDARVAPAKGATTSSCD